jgi:hypothetical protein
MKTHLDMNKIARGLGAERRGQVASAGGYFGATQLLADVTTRIRAPAAGSERTRVGLNGDHSLRRGR